MTNQKTSPASEPHSDPPPPDLPRESARTILFQFVVFPLVVVLVGVGVFLLFGVLASEEHSIREYVNTIRSGSPHRRWQAAYQLSKSLRRGEAKEYPDLAVEIGSIYASAKNDDPKIRRYLSMVLGTLGDARATPVLIEGLKDEDIETRIYALWALGEIGDRQATPAIAAMAKDPDHDVRKTALFALGKSGDPRGVPVLVESLSDEIADVRWNAALALARLGDRRAIPVLEEMLDRSRLASIAGLREDQKEIAMSAAVSAYSRLAGANAKALLAPLARTDPNMRVRSVAAAALKSEP